MMRNSTPCPDRKVILCISILLCLSGAACLRSASLNLEAQIVYTMGGPQPVARQEFYLLDVDPFSVKQEKQNTSTQGETIYVLSVINWNMFAEQVRLAQERDIPLDKKLIPMVANAKVFLAPHIVQTAQTDFQGRAVFENLSPGDYWLMGIAETRSSAAFWNYKVTIESGENKVLLDQNNALYAR
jgi:hypothetical protein